MNRKILLIILTMVLGIGTLCAQEKAKKSREEMRKEFREFKIKFIAQEIDLQEDQQKQFAELYDQMCDERMKIFEQTRRLERKVKKESNATEEDYASVSRALTEAKEKDAAIEKKYDAKFSTFLSSKQIFKMKAAEEKFRKKMSEMRHKKKNR